MGKRLRKWANLHREPRREEDENRKHKLSWNRIKILIPSLLYADLLKLNASHILLKATQNMLKSIEKKKGKKPCRYIFLKNLNPSISLKQLFICRLLP